MFQPKTKTIFTVLLAPFLWLVHACSPLGDPVDAEKSNSHYYNKDNTQIRYSPMGNWFELGNSAMKADVKSFEVLSRWLSRDKNHVYFEAYQVENAQIDLATFEVKNTDFMTNIAFDKDFVYAFSKVYKNNSYHGVVKVVEGADPNRYERTDWVWANDGTHHFYNDNRIAADFDSFQTLNDYFAKDNYKTFVKNDTIFEAFEADINTLKILDKSNHALDNNKVYWLPFFTKNSPNLRAIPYENEAKVAFLNRYFLRIADTIYFDGTARKDIDANSFEIIDHSYAKDASKVYYKDQVISNADPISFKPLEGSYKYADKNGVYHKGKLEKNKEAP